MGHGQAFRKPETRVRVVNKNSVFFGHVGEVIGIAFKGFLVKLDAAPDKELRFDSEELTPE